MRFTSAPFSSGDIVAHLIPGAIILGLTLWFLDGFVGLIINLMSLGTGVVSLVIWLLAAYIAGVFVHLFSRFLAGGKLDAIESMLAVQFIAESDNRFTTEFKKELAARANKIFGYAATGEELYRLCLQYGIQRDAASKAKSLSAFGDMYRGLLATARVGIAISGLMVLKHLVLLLLPQFNILVPVTGFLDYETVHLVIGLMLLVVLAAAVRLLKERVVFCASEAVSSVYAGFLVRSAENVRDAT